MLMQDDPRSQLLELADPGSIGFLGFGIACGFTSATMLGVISNSALSIAAGLIFGGLAQFYAAHIYFKKNMVFAATVFGAFGLYWFYRTFASLILYGVFSTPMLDAANAGVNGIIDGFFLLFIFFMMLGSAPNGAVFFGMLVFVVISLLGFTLIDFNVIPALATKMTGIAQLALTFINLYIAIGITINAHLGREVFKFGKKFDIF